MKLDPFISDLLYEHDCVIIPDFGGFICQNVPAKHDPTQHRFTPPGKQLSFNKNLRDNDGLLTNHIARAEGLSFEQAGHIIAAYRTHILTELDERQNITLDSIGTLYKDRHQNIRFEPDLSQNFLLSSFGLPAFHSLPVPVQETESATEERIDQPSVAPVTRRRKKRAYIPYAALLLLLISYLAWLPTQSDLIQDGSLNYGALNPFGEDYCPVYDVRLESADFSAYDANDQPSLASTTPDTVTYFALGSLFSPEDEAYNPNKKIIVEWNKPVVKVPPAQPVSDRILPYHIIAGCFSVKGNAGKMVGKLEQQGFEAQIVDVFKGLYRVSLSSFATRREAVRKLRELQNLGHPQAWILKK